MQNPLYKKPEDSDFTNPSTQRKFTEETQSSKELMQKEFDVNQANQGLLEKRILIMKETLNNIPSSDPQYSMLAIQIQMDKVELDELKSREQTLSKLLSSN